MKQQILSVLPGAHPWQNTLICCDEIPSTNDMAKALAVQGAPAGTVVTANSQTAGRGRLGRSFHAPKGLGVYLSVILRPDCTPDRIMHLTCAVAEAMCDAVESYTGCRPQIKWTNDLVADGKKLGGVLTELSVNPATGKVEWVVAGIGINCLQALEDFPEDIRSMATSLRAWTGKDILPGYLAGHMILALSKMSEALLSEKAVILDAYRKDCMTVGKQIVLVRGDEKRYGTALDVAADGGLVVRFEDGALETVQSGEISVRGLYGYV